MKVATTKTELDQLIQNQKGAEAHLKVGFVPTMGALHNGHKKLIQEAAKQSDIVVVSIFVNPTQFNKKSDLLNYPRSISEDKALLEKAACDILFYPSESEIYPNGVAKINIDLKGVDEVMEGAFRPNHFDGVIMVVNRLFELVQPNIAFFGKKDFQQLAIIKLMVKELGWPINIIEVDIQRDARGLALSSRNALLSVQEKENALILYQTLEKGKEWIKSADSIQTLKDKMIRFFSTGQLQLEYLSIVDNESLQEVNELKSNLSCCIAAFCGEVRLIDNVQLA